MKPNTFTYVLYGIYALAIILLVKFLLFNPESGMLKTVVLWLGIPLLLSLIFIILIKCFFLRRFMPTMPSSDRLKIALHGTLTTIGIPIVYVSIVALFLSMLTIVGAQQLPILGMDIPQNAMVIALELLSLLIMFAWINRFVELHVIWPLLKKDIQRSMRRVLLYSNMIGYFLLTVIFVVWQVKILFQLSEWF